MAGRVVIPVTEVVREGVLAPSYVTADAANNHYIAANDGDVELEVVNSSGTAQTIAVVANPELNNDGLTFSNLSLTVPTGATGSNPGRYGPFRPNTFKQDSSGMLYLNPSVSTTIKIRAFKRAQARN